MADERNRMNRRMLTEILGGRFDTAEATSGEECLHLLEENRDGISIVLLDIHMEGMDGFAVLEEMDRQKMLEDIPVIMISSEDKVDAMRRAFDLGASDYISRPFDARVVCQRIGNTMRLYAKQRRLCGGKTDPGSGSEQPDHACAAEPGNGKAQRREPEPCAAYPDHYRTAAGTAGAEKRAALAYGLCAPPHHIGGGAARYRQNRAGKPAAMQYRPDCGGRDTAAAAYNAGCTDAGRKQYPAGSGFCADGGTDLPLAPRTI